MAPKQTHGKKPSDSTNAMGKTTAFQKGLFHERFLTTHYWSHFLYYLMFKRREENQLDANECFIAIIICSTCFGHLYAHHQELETILVLLQHMVCNALVANGRLLGVEQQAMRPG